jgi:hypothetical protein
MDCLVWREAMESKNANMTSEVEVAAYMAFLPSYLEEFDGGVFDF